MLRTTILFLSIFFTVSLSAQKYMPKGGKYGGKKTKYRQPSSHLKRNPTDVFPLDPEYKLSGWFLALGGTYMLPMSSSDEKFYERSTFNDSILEVFSEYQGKPSGKLGIYAEAGWFKSFAEPKFFHFFDIGISYRQYKGSESFSGKQWQVVSDTNGQEVFRTEPTYTNQSDDYSDQIISLVSNLTHHYHFSRYGFIQNTIGANIDYFFSTSRSGGPTFPGYEAQFPEQMQAQLHYRLGVGWKASPTILIIPSVEVPILTAYPWDDFKSSLLYYSSRHYPILFSIRVMFLRRISEDCIVPEYDGPSNFQ